MTRRSLRVTARITSSESSGLQSLTKMISWSTLSAAKRLLQPVVHDRDCLGIVVTGDNGSHAVPRIQAELLLPTTTRKPVCRKANEYQSVVRRSPVVKSVRGSQRSRWRALSILAYQSGMSQRRRRHRVLRRSGDTEDFPRHAGDFDHRRLASRADVERASVISLLQIQRRLDLGFGHVVDVNEIPRDPPAGQIGNIFPPGHNARGWARAATSPRGGRTPNTA